MLSEAKHPATIRQIFRRVVPQDELNDEQSRSADRQRRRRSRRLGYAQQLIREMSGFSNFAISFSIISILTGAMLLYGYGLKFAGPIINSVGWPVVSLFTLAVAASMAEIASAYPTAGSGEWMTKRTRAVIARPMASADQRRRHRVGDLHRHRLHAAAERAGALDDDRRVGFPRHLLVFVGEATLRWRARCGAAALGGVSLT
jgi:hypothetical protein